MAKPSPNKNAVVLTLQETQAFLVLQTVWPSTDGQLQC